MVKKAKPAPCPWCGAKPKVTTPCGRDDWQVSCYECSARGPGWFDTSGEAIEVWNKVAAVVAASKEYWSMHWYGTYQRCSAHKSAEAAIKAAKKCERAGGSYHDIWECRRIKRKKRRHLGVPKT